MGALDAVFKGFCTSIFNEILRTDKHSALSEIFTNSF